ncbi:hypothetical protein [Janthinobacterium psychrotolerans]|uniref:HlyD family secretion protein n=1 Tax=Janthinobacterium psychrotolerans TaxID=1747903 RepID=A0A1A7BW66_9BURK|nr:hypothetical protein [Janthinobacterium psychrotolerans]OBV37821.1 HlyD family secretion protein [Janthinobacterium psychrotolerans]
MLTGEVVRLSLGATGNGSNIRSSVQPGVSVRANDGQSSANAATMYRARIRLPQQLRAPDGAMRPLAAGMQVVAEIHHGRRTVLEYLLAALKKAVGEAARKG